MGGLVSSLVESLEVIVQAVVGCYGVLLCVAFQGELLWRTDDIVRIIQEQGDSIALVFFSGKCRGCTWLQAWNGMRP